MIDLGRARALVATKGQRPETERLHDLFRESWDYVMTEYPEFASYVGYPGHDHRWADLSLSAIDRRNVDLEHAAAVVASLDRAALSPADQLNLDLFRRGLEEALEGRRFKGEYMPLSQMQGVQQDLARVVAFTRPRSAADYEAMLERLRGVPGVIGQTITLLGQGLEAGLTPPKVTLRDVPQQVANQVVEDPGQSPFLVHFQRFPEQVPGAEQERLRRAAEEAYRSAIAPAFRA